ncbi:MAG: ABC transporter ATP-binding protein [Ruminococcaceae bacterium]|nr:ABC transporter ATP-binding protein [Oscillospiraceae bacterium]
MIELNNICKTYRTRQGQLEVLKNINLTIPAGAFVMLVGESGSGKSTLCNILGLLDTPTAGEYFMEDRAVHTLSSSGRTKLRREKVSFVFQSFNLIPTMTAWDNIELPLGYRNLPKEERRMKTEAALASVGLTARAKHLPGELSGGEQQRVAIARALAVDPALLIADEPTGNLDKKTTAGIMELLRETCRQKTVFMVTHNEDLLPYADRVLRLRQGSWAEL